MTSFRDRRMQTAVWAGVGLAVLVLLWLLSPILAPFAVAAVLAYICDPMVTWLVARRLPRAAAVLIVIAVLGLALLLLLLILVPTVYREAVALIARLPDLVEMINTTVLPRLKAHMDVNLQLDAGSIRQWVTENWSSAQDLLPGLLKKAGTGGAAVIGFFANLLLIPMVMFYLLQEWPHITEGLRRIIPRPMVDRSMRILGDIDRVMSEFLRGQLSVMLLLAIFYSIGLWLAGLKFALPVGVITGLLVFVPFVGFTAGLVLALLSAVLQAQGWPPIIGVAVVYSLGQLIESFLLTPYIVGDRIGLHPLVVIFALMAFGQLFGFVGVMVALPASAALLVALRELRGAYFASHVYLGDAAHDDDAA
ncbi:AI-2E family transporter [Nitrogeniibacter mangrovi]|uniref:AI-2E family transporter n=1 Tax=Nitrogeniibacter mangrovi TaxID=2016596 RepID=A0A6C1B804_9RHOO|nr:AI-2E family transporter [Nitrogeniibacter mangrovi]QID18450.1 AI-2E family transporter [Nitrogeniibacter mangrovi]